MITFQRVTKQFDENSFALKDVSFDIAPGEFVFLTGPSGSGKTTIMRLVTKEYTPTEGEILFDDAPISEIRKSKIHLHRRKIGVVFQDYKLLPELNVWENIALALYIISKSQEEIESRVTDLLRLVNLVDKAYLFPSQLSGGEAQRVSIARALATGPSVIFADEPTGNLDPETSVTIARLLKKINELGTTVLLATHDQGVLQTIPEARRLHLNKGQLVEDHGHKVHHEATVEKQTKAEVKETKAAMADIVEDLAEQRQTESATEPSTKSPVVSSVENIETSDKPAKKGLHLPKIGWPFGKKTKATSAPDEVVDDDKNEDLNHLDSHPSKHDHHRDNSTSNHDPIKVKVEALDSQSKK